MHKVVETAKPNLQKPVRLEKEAAERAAATTPRAVSARAVLIGLVFAVFFCAITPYNDFKIAATYIAGTQFPIGAIFVVFLFSGVVNVALRRWRPAKAFTSGELLTIWT